VTLDVASIEKKLRMAIEWVLLEEKIPVSVKAKFLEDLQHRLEILANIDMNTINNFKSARNLVTWSILTFWQVSLEEAYIASKFPNVKDQNGYYLEKIIQENLAKYVEPTAHSLISIYTAPRYQHGERSYHRGNFEEFNEKLPEFYTDMAALDNKYWSDVKQITQNFFQTEYSYGYRDREKNKEVFLEKEIGSWLLEQYADQLRSIKIVKFWKERNAYDSFRSVFIDGAWTQALNGFQWKLNITLQNGEKMDFLDLWREYTWVLGKHSETFRKFNIFQDEFREAKLRAEDHDAWSWARKASQTIFSVDHLKSSFDELKPDDVAKKIDSASFPDLIIIGFQLSQLVPGAGNITGTLDAGIGTLYGVDSHGEVYSTKWRILLAVFATLGIVVPINALRKSPSIVKALSRLQIAFTKGFEDFLEVTKVKEKMSPEALQKLLVLAAWLWVQESTLAKLGSVKTGTTETVAGSRGWRTSWSEVIKVAEANWTLDDVQKIHKVELWKLGVIENLTERQAKFYERIKDLEQIKELSKAQIEAILAMLVKIHELHGNIPIGQHNRRQIVDKMQLAQKLLEEAWVPADMITQIRQIAVKEGFAGHARLVVNEALKLHTFRSDEVLGNIAGTNWQRNIETFLWRRLTSSQLALIEQLRWESQSITQTSDIYRINQRKLDRLYQMGFNTEESYNIIRSWSTGSLNLTKLFDSVVVKGSTGAEKIASFEKELWSMAKTISDPERAVVLKLIENLSIYKLESVPWKIADVEVFWKIKIFQLEDIVLSVKSSKELVEQVSTFLRRLRNNVPPLKIWNPPREISIEDLLTWRVDIYAVWELPVVFKKIIEGTITKILAHPEVQLWDIATFPELYKMMA
jgi:hypothetical protein